MIRTVCRVSPTSAPSYTTQPAVLNDPNKGRQIEFNCFENDTRRLEQRDIYLFDLGGVCSTLLFHSFRWSLGCDVTLILHLHLLHRLGSCCLFGFQESQRCLAQKIKPGFDEN